MIIGQYFYMGDEENWENKLRDDTPFDKLTRLYIAFSGIDDQGKLAFKSSGRTPTIQKHRLEQLMQACRCKNPTAEIFISTHYSSWADYGMTDRPKFSKAAQNPEGFADSVVSFLRSYKLDGYDMDWEDGIDKDLLMKLLSVLNTKLKEQKYKLTVAVWQLPDGYGYPDNLTEMGKLVDQINIMSYGGGSEALHESVDAYTRKGISKEKIIGGIQTEECLDDEKAIKAKCQYAVQNGLAGMFAWRLDNDYSTYIDEKEKEKKEGKKKSTYQGAIYLYNFVSKSALVPIFRYHTDYPNKYPCFYYSPNPADIPWPQWSFDGIAFYGVGKEEPGAREIWQYRAENPQRYCYVIDHVGEGWTNDKIVFYAFKEARANTLPVYQYYIEIENKCWNLLYSTDPNIKGNWIRQDPIFYVYG